MKASINASRGSTSGFAVHFSQTCSACTGNSKSARREFSDQAWAALVSWGEIQGESIDQPICNPCYFNLRDVLIDRSEDISIMQNGNGNHLNSSTSRTSARVAAG